MHPQSIYDPGFAAFGGGSSHTILHPIVVAALTILGLLIFFLPRKYVVIPMFIGLLVIPYGQNLYIGGSHIYTTRLFILFGIVRLACTAALSGDTLLPGGFTTLDKVFSVWAFYRSLAPVLVFMQWGAVPNGISFLWAALGGYFLFRWLIQDEEDILRLIKTLALIAAVAAIGMVYEQHTVRNMFAFLGGIRSTPEIRNGRIRSQGMFAHALLAGSFGATMFPLFVWLWVRGKSWFLAMIGLASSIVMVFAASTSTPLMAWMGGLLALLLWPARKSMRYMRWGIVAALAGAQMVMKAPVWFVLAHIDLSGGSTGWDRAMLIDNLVRHFPSWWLIGTHDNVNWGFDMWDSCNQFVAEGISGGLVCFICFIYMFVLCFRMVGNARKAVEGDKRREWLFWIVGATLVAQAMAYFGIDYFDQTVFVWYALLVIIAVIARVSPSRAPLAHEEISFAPAGAKAVENIIFTGNLSRPYGSLSDRILRTRKSL